MSLITPAGKMDFVWSPVDSNLEKTASADKGAKAPKTDKDILFEAAKKVIKKANLAELGIADTSIGGDKSCPPCETVPENLETPVGDDSAEVAGTTEVSTDKSDKPVVAPDAVKAVQELVDKADKAEEVAAKVGEAVSKVEEAVQGVKDAVGVTEVDDAGAVKDNKDNDEVVMEVEVEEEDGDKKVEVEVEDKDDDEEKKDDDIVKESVEACATAKAEMKTAANDPDDLYKISKISPTTRKKVYQLWKDYLDYAPDYCKLMVTDYEK